MMFITTLLAETQQYAPPQPSIWFMILNWLPGLIGLAFYVLLAFCIYRASKYFRTAGGEVKLMRMEIGKLAEEAHLLRQELEKGRKQDSGMSG